MQSTKPERLILKIPKLLWRSKGLAFCYPLNKAVLSFSVLIVFLFFWGLFSYYVYVPLLVNVSVGATWVFAFSLIALSLLPTIFIRKDCFECQFSFHIIAHERNHLILRKSEEIVEEETLKQTGVQLIPLLLSDSKMCKDCLFLWHKLYCQATFNYLRKQKEAV